MHKKFLLKQCVVKLIVRLLFILPFVECANASMVPSINMCTQTKISLKNDSANKSNSLHEVDKTKYYLLCVKALDGEEIISQHLSLNNTTYPVIVGFASKKGDNYSIHIDKVSTSYCSEIGRLHVKKKKYSNAFGIGYLHPDYFNNKNLLQIDKKVCIRVVIDIKNKNNYPVNVNSLSSIDIRIGTQRNPQLFIARE